MLAERHIVVPLWRLILRFVYKKKKKKKTGRHRHRVAYYLQIILIYILKGYNILFIILI